MNHPYVPVLIFFGVALAVPIGSLVLARLWMTFFTPIKRGKEKNALYECGVNPLAERQTRFHSQYYLFGLLFLLFDVETIFLLPFAVASNSIPIVAMAPLAIVWFGIDEGSKIAIVAVMCFFPTLISAVHGFRAAAPEAVELMVSYAASEWQIFTKLRVPSALPFIFNALKVCSTLSMIGAIVAEFFGGSTKFLGIYIKTEANILHTTNAWAAIIVACIFGLTFYLVIVAIERLVMPWQPESR